MAWKGLKKIVWVAVALAVVYLPAMWKLHLLNKENLRLESSISQLHRSNAVLKKEMEMLHNDLSYVEKIAREKMGVVRKGEIVYEVVVEGDGE